MKRVGSDRTDGNKRLAEVVVCVRGEREARQRQVQEEEGFYTKNSSKQMTRRARETLNLSGQPDKCRPRLRSERK